MESIYLLLANAVLVLHGLIVAFNVGALPFIWAGHFWHWPVVRNPYFRLSHVLLLGLVTAETCLGLTCPLTTLENALRLRAATPLLYSEGFLSHWLHDVLFWDVSPALLGTLYGLFLALVGLTLFVVKPRQLNWRALEEFVPPRSGHG